MSATWVAVPLVVGAVVRRQARLATEADDRRREAEASVERQRQQIARELHDVVAHALTVMVLHARAGSTALDRGDDGDAAAALRLVEAVARDALDDMRRLVTVIRLADGRRVGADGDRGADGARDALTTSGLLHLPGLVATVTDAGLRVDLRVDGSLDRLPPGVDATAYRVLQEALTNVARHAGPGTTAHVRVSRTTGEVRLDVEDDGPGTPAGTARPAGHGLAGMAERVGVYGGRLEAGPGDGGGFRVRAVLPVPDR